MDTSKHRIRQTNGTNGTKVEDKIFPTTNLPEIYDCVQKVRKRNLETINAEKNNAVDAGIIQYNNKTRGEMMNESK